MAITAKSPHEAHLGDNGLTVFEAAPSSFRDTVADQAAAVDNTPEEHTRVVRSLARLDWVALERCMQFAAIAHRNQFDKGGEPYLWHVLRVGIGLLPDIDAACCGVLHDVLEDCPGMNHAIVLDALRDDEELMRALKLLKKEKGEDYSVYIRRCGSHPLARKVKIADLHDNLDDRRQQRAIRAGHGDSIYSLRDKYEAALFYLSSGLTS